MFVLRFVQYAHLLPTPAIPYKRDGKAIVYCIPTKQISYYANVILVLQTLSLLPFFGESDRKFLKNNKFFKPVFQKNVVKNAYVSTFRRHILFLRRYLANYCLQTGLQLNSTINQIIYQVEFVCFLKNTKIKAELTAVG